MVDGRRFQGNAEASQRNGVRICGSLCRELVGITNRSGSFMYIYKYVYIYTGSTVQGVLEGQMLPLSSTEY